MLGIASPGPRILDRLFEIPDLLANRHEEGRAPPLLINLKGQLRAHPNNHYISNLLLDTCLTGGKLDWRAHAL